MVIIQGTKVRHKKCKIGLGRVVQVTRMKFDRVKSQHYTNVKVMWVVLPAFLTHQRVGYTHWFDNRDLVWVAHPEPDFDIKNLRYYM